MGRMYLRSGATWIEIADTEGSITPESPYVGTFRLRVGSTWHRGVDRLDYEAHPVNIVLGPSQVMYFSDGWTVATGRLNRLYLPYQTSRAMGTAGYGANDNFTSYGSDGTSMASRGMIVVNTGTSGAPVYQYRRFREQQETFFVIDWNLLRSHRRFTTATLSVEYGPSYIHRHYVAGDDTYSNRNSWTPLSPSSGWQAYLWRRTDLSPTVTPLSLSPTGLYGWANGVWAYVPDAYGVIGGGGSLVDTIDVVANNNGYLTQTFNLGDVSAENYRIYHLTTDVPTPFDASVVPADAPLANGSNWVGFEESVWCQINNITVKLT